MIFADVKEWRIPEGEVTKVVDSQNRIIWEKETAEYSGFWIKSLYADAIISFSCIGNQSKTIEYSRNGSDWNTLGTVTAEQPITLNTTLGNKVYFRCNTSRFGISNNSVTKIDVDEKYAVGGNIMSLLYGKYFTGNETTFPYDNYTGGFYGTFSNSTLLQDASELILPIVDLVNAYPSTSLRTNAYSAMFAGCSSLLFPPELPAVILSPSCYSYIFQNCSSLLRTPTLPATVLSHNCYNFMFSGCSSLTKAPDLPATTLDTYCYNFMFYNCTSLTSAPTLPATTLTDSSYSNMFSGCTSLNKVTCYATSGINTSYSTSNWLDNVSSTGTFYKKAGVTWPTGTSGIPSGWTVVEV